MQLPGIPKPEMVGTATLVSLLVAAGPASAMFNCEKVVIDKVKFDLMELGGPHTIQTTQYEPPNHLNNTYTLDICSPLKIRDDVKKKEQCPNGTRVCGVKRIVEGETNLVEKVIPISHAQHGQPLEWSATRLKDSASDTDKEKEGIRLSLKGPKYAGLNQKAIIDFVCVPGTEGTERNEDTGSTERAEGAEVNKEQPEQEQENKQHASWGRRDVHGGNEDGSNEEGGSGEETQVNKEGFPIQFLSYGWEQNSGWEGDVLRLEWRTKYACEKKSGGDDGSENGNDKEKEDQSRTWGFFTWMVIIVFLGISAYLIFGSWLNYTRYGARGWDLIPHGDTIRDVPYLTKDWTRSVLNTVQGLGTRGGYSAV